MTFDDVHPKRQPFRIWTLLMIAVLLPFGGCVANSKTHRTTRIQNAQEVLDRLSSRYPNGISVDDAIRSMTAEGFECSREESSTFTERIVHPDGSLTKVKHEAIDFIRCTQRTQDGLVTTVLSVALVIEDGQIVRALENKLFVGP